MKNPRNVVSESLNVIRSSPSDPYLEKTLSADFYFTQDSCGVVQEVYYSENDSDEAIALKKGITVLSILFSCFFLCFFLKGILSGFSLNLTMSHEMEYESNDIDENGLHRGRFTISPGATSGTYHIAKSHKHEDYIFSTSQENNFEPGDRDEKRQHFVYLVNNR